MSTKEEKCLLYCVLVLLTFDWTISKNSDANLDVLTNSAHIKRLKRQDDQATDECRPTPTTVRGKKACAGQTIFEDYFFSLREDVWQIEQFIPENPFVSYQKNDLVIYASDGKLHIMPMFQSDFPGFTNASVSVGTLDLFDGCTSHGKECYRQASGADILPPVVSGRIKSKNFAFTYGTVQIRAKLPQGDWFYPELLLEPFFKKYGKSNFASGVMKIAAARGNKELWVDLVEYGNKVLYGGPIMNLKCRDRLLSNKTLEEGSFHRLLNGNYVSNYNWGELYHDYSLTWTPDYISLSVDGEQWGLVQEPMALVKGFNVSYCSGLPVSRLNGGTKMAPFDVDFGLTLGMAVGGTTEFPDDSYSGDGRPKPWRNAERKAMVAFLEDLPTRKYDHNLMMSIDYVKVVAL